MTVFGFGIQGFPLIYSVSLIFSHVVWYLRVPPYLFCPGRCFCPGTPFYDILHAHMVIIQESDASLLLPLSLLPSSLFLLLFVATL